MVAQLTSKLQLYKCNYINKSAAEGGSIWVTVSRGRFLATERNKIFKKEMPMKDHKPPILVIDGEVRIELPENRTTYSTLMMISLMNDAQRDLVHTFVAGIYNLGQVKSDYLDLTDIWFKDKNAEH